MTPAAWDLGTSSSLVDGLMGSPAAALYFASSPEFVFYRKRTTHTHTHTDWCNEDGLTVQQT